MDYQFIPFILTLAGALAAAFIGWTIVSVMSVNRELAALKLHVAENYVSNPELVKLELHLERVDSKVNSMLELLYKISARVGTEGPH